MCAQGRCGFSLLEVMIAVAIFFMAIFSILELTSRSLKAAHALRQSTPDIGSVISDLFLTNSLMEGSESGDFGRAYPGYGWTRQVSIAGTNGLFQVDVSVVWVEDKRQKEDRMSVLLYKPSSVISSRGRVSR